MKLSWRASGLAAVVPVLVLLRGSSAYAQAEPLTVVDAVRAALATHPVVDAAEAGVDRAAAGRREAGAARLPSLAADLSANRFQEPMVVAPLHGFDPTNPPEFDRTLLQGRVSLAYTVFDGGARSARIERASAAAGAAEAGMGAAEQALAAEIVGAYLRLASAAEVLHAHERRMAALHAERQRAATLVEEGRAPRLTQIRAEAALSAARADSLAAAQEVAVARRELARGIGRDPELGALRTASVRLRDAGDDPGGPGPSRRAADANPEIRRLRHEVAAAAAGGAEARALLLPRVNVLGGWAEYGSGGSLPADAWQGEWQAGVQLSYPILTGGSRQAGIQAASARLRGARAELEAAELRLANALDRAAAAMETARSRAAALQVAVEQADEVARIERLSLDEGAGVQSDYLAAEAELLRARAALSEARYTEILARVELARLAGELTPAWLENHLEVG